jgi:3-hydroxyacyl-CoA dehydrogenase
MQAPALDQLQLDADAWYPPFRQAAVLGAGVMGAQIAAHLANAGLNVLLLDVAPKTIGQDGPNNALVEKAFKQASKLKPDPFMSEAAKRRVTLGNFEDDFAKIGGCDWIIEVVVERMDVKRDVMKRIEEHASDSAVISSNTSGLPIGEIAEGRSDGFKKRFLGTHFFNPPRYLKLFEMIPTEETDPEVVARVARFARVHLGKGVVIAKDTPNFIGNRIGVYSMMGAIEMLEGGDYSMEEIDQLTGTIIGHAKSATFRTADVVGLDTLQHVTENLYENVPHDESRERFQTRDMIRRLIDLKQTGQKAGAGFYKKDKKRGILSFDLESGEYTEPKDSDLDLSKLKKGDLKTRLNNLWEDDGRAGAFFRKSSLDLFGYSARRIPEIADRPLEVDRAIAWGFGWEMGPFEQWDALGVDKVRQALQDEGIEVPDWVDAVPDEGFYRELQPGQREVWNPQKGLWESAAMPKDEVGLAAIKSDEKKTLWQNDEAALLDLGDGVALFEFRSKANSLGQAVMDGLVEAIRKVEDDRDLRGMVIGNEGGNFSVGANLGEVVMGMGMGGVESIEPFIEGFQNAVQAVRYSQKPVVVATHQRVLGGGCEITMACPNPVLAAETYIGLVELGVGLIPAGTGTMRMAAWAADQAANRDRPSEIQPFLRQAFETIAMANVATSAPMAKELGFVPESAIVVMNDARRFHVAKQEVIRLSNEGYLPPAVMEKIPVLGAAGRAQFDIALFQFRDGNYISEYDQYLAQKLAYIMTGGALTGPAEVHEDYLLELEREVFLSLLGEEKTQERIASILTTNKPLRN